MEDLCVGADAVLDGRGGVLAPGWVRLQGERVVEIARGEAPSDGRVWRGRAGSVLLPGLISAHTHLVYGDMEGLGEGQPFYTWLTKTMLGALRGPELAPDRQRRAASRARARLLAGGVTSLGENAPSLAALDEFAPSDGVFFCEVFGSMEADLDTARYEALARCEETAERAGVRRIGPSPHTPWTCPPAVFADVVAWAREGGHRVSTHLEESVEERAFFLEGRGPLREVLERRGTLDRYEAQLGRSPTAALEELGLLGPELLAAHCVQCGLEDVERLARHAVHPVHCPASNARLCEGIAPVHEMLEAGLEVALGVDSPASNERFDLFEEMRLAVLMQRARRRGAARPDPMEAVRMATHHGARALGLDDRGHLRPGARGDLLVVEPDPLRAPKGLAPEVFVALACDRSHVRLVVRGGEVVHEPAR